MDPGKKDKEFVLVYISKAFIFFKNFFNSFFIYYQCAEVILFLNSWVNRNDIFLKICILAH